VFAEGSLQTTYTGPIYATGETLRRQRTDARALGNLLGDERAYLTQGRGIAAGNKGDRYRAGIQADQKMQDQYLADQKAIMASIGDRADSRFQYQTNQSEELAGLRNLMLSNDQIAQNYELNTRGNQIQQDAAKRQMVVQRRAAENQQRASLFSNILGIFT
jgi:hypothetical protein